MQVTPTPLQGAYIIQPTVFADERGYFFESFNEEKLHEFLPRQSFVQDNEAKSTKGVLRGLHYQVPPYAQSKLVRVILGEVLDVIVDIRPGSRSYGHWYGIRLSDKNKTQLYVPRGFAHGYVTLSDVAIFAYKCDQFYARDHEGGIRFDDPGLVIDWELGNIPPLLSEKDRVLPNFGMHRAYTELPAI